MKNLDELANELLNQLCFGIDNTSKVAAFLEANAIDILNAKALKMSGVSSNARGAPSATAIMNGMAHAVLPAPTVVTTPLGTSPVKYRSSMFASSDIVWKPTELQKRIHGDFVKWDGSEATPHPKCECGSDKLGLPRHSSWCSKHSKE